MISERSLYGDHVNYFCVGIFYVSALFVHACIIRSIKVDIV